MVIAFIGTRAPGDVPNDWLNLYRRTATLAGACGHPIITGAAPGSDQLAAQCVLAAGGRVALILPWKGFERPWVQRIVGRHHNNVYVDILPEEIPAEALASVRTYHPAYGSLTQGGKRLHARNYLIVQHAELIVALPSDKPGGGGTGQGIRIAEALGKPCVDLSLAVDRKGMDKWLLKMRNTP